MVSPLDKIPATWAYRARCPVCGDFALSVHHHNGAPDTMDCGNCDTSFEAEAEAEGNHIRIKSLSEKSGINPGLVVGKWITIPHIKDLAKGKSPKEIKRQLYNFAVPTKEVYKKTKKLLELGNTPAQTKVIMLQAKEVDERQVNYALRRIAKEKKAEEQQRIKVAWIIGIVGGVVVLFLAVAFIISLSNRQNDGLEDLGQPFILPTAFPTTALNTSDLPLPPISDMLPEEMIPLIIGQGNPSVTSSGPGGAACPEDSITAANLFGGTSNYWATSEDAPDSWIMLSTEGPVIITVPERMTAGYLSGTGTNPEIVKVAGPSTISRVSFAVVICSLI